MKPKKFRLEIRDTFGYVGIDDAMQSLMEHEYERVVAMEVGDVYLDSDGDTWERVE